MNSYTCMCISSLHDIIITFSSTHIKHMVRLGLYPPFCVDKVKQRVLLTLDGLETATV